MNPFEDIDNSDTNVNTNSGEKPWSGNKNDVSENSSLWLETAGRRKNTYISGLPFTFEELKEHLKTLKKKHGCNGAVKEDDNLYVLHLQGDHIDDIIDYFKQHNVTNITIRG